MTDNPKTPAGAKKVPLDLISPVASVHEALALLSGSLEYGPWSWRTTPINASTYIASARRHLDLYASRHNFDAKSGAHHLGHLRACAGILLDAQACGKLNDDRPPGVDLDTLLDQAQSLVDHIRKQKGKKDAQS